MIEESSVKSQKQRCVQPVMRVIAAVVIASSVGLFVGPAAAQGDDIEGARAAFDRGQELFGAGEFAEALRAYEASFNAFPHFRTIFNMALCHENLGHLREALDDYQRYVDWPAEVPNRAEVVEKIETLKRQLPPAPPTSETPVDPPQTDEPVVDRTPRDDGPMLVPVVRRVQPKSRPKLAAAGWVTLGVGAAGLITGGALLIRAGQISAEMRAAEDNNDAYDPQHHGDLSQQGRRLELGGWITGGAGLALIITGVVLLVRSRPGVEPTSVPQIGLLPSPDGASTVVSWRF